MEKKYSALVVDDRDNWRDLLGELLLEGDFDVDYASDYEGALESMLEKDPPYHLVVTDIRLVDEEQDNEDGIRLLDTLKKYSQFTKTIVITGYPSIDTAKKALSGEGSALDYFEKFPANRKGFDEEGYIQTAKKAANLADEGRPDSLTQREWNILIIEPNLLWRKKLVDLLQKLHYLVDQIDSIDSLLPSFQQENKSYGLIFIRDKLLNNSDTFFLYVQKYHPESKIVMLTDQFIENIVRKIQEGSIFSVVTLQDDLPFTNNVHEVTKGAFMPWRQKYINADISIPKEKLNYKIGEKCILELEIQDKWRAEATPVSFSPQHGAYGKSLIKVFTFAPSCKIISGTERFWDVSKSNPNKKFLIEFIPQTEGEVKISIDLDQDNRWIGRIEKTIQVSG